MRSIQCVYRLTYLQGIDLKDIDLVIQWKVTCDPCMMWQRFGRGARDKSVQATALLFVEPKDLDPVNPPEGRKRKTPGADNKGEPTSKRARKEKPVPRILDSNAAGEEEFWEARKAVYHEPTGDEKKGELNQVLDDVVNAEGRGIGCRRTPFNVYFDNNEHPGLYTSLLCSALNNIPQESAAATMLLMSLVLVVRHDRLVSAATSAIRKSLGTCFESPMQDQKPSHADRR